MASKVPYGYTLEINDKAIKTGKPVKSSQWKDISTLSNYLNACGGSLIPAHIFMRYNIEGGPGGINQGSTYTFRYFVYPRTPAHSRLWIFRFAANQVGEALPHNTKMFKGTISLNGAATFEFSSGDHSTTIFSVEQVASSDTPVEITAAIYNDTDSEVNLLVEQISCFELGRHHLFTGEADVKSSQMGSVRKGQIIREKSEKSVFGPFEGIAEARETNRRNGIYHYCNPDGLEATATGWANIHQLTTAMQHEALARTLVSATVEASLRINIYAKVDSGTAQVGILPSYTAASSHTLAFSNTTAAWHSTYGHLVPTRPEDLSAGDGRRNSDWSTIQYVARVVTANTLTIYAISVGEMADDN